MSNNQDQVKNVYGKPVSLTEMELNVYNSIKDWGELDDCHADCAESISDNTEIPTNKIRGVISSLVQKKVAYVDELFAGCGEMVILFENK
tara:strand:+ start:407 stop:676 length:270 start_codon:yes stop_codon:yes gene_type:complete